MAHSPSRSEQRRNVIEIWKAVIEVQRHFNEIGMRIRSMFITILLALFAAIGFLIDKKWRLEIHGMEFDYAAIVPLFGLFIAYLFYFFDRYWYHRLLVGSVKHGIAIEAKYKRELPELALSEALGAESPYEPKGLARWLANIVVRHDKYRRTGQLHSDGKIEFFYKSVMLVLFITMIFLTYTTSVAPTRRSDRLPEDPAAAVPVVPQKKSLPLTKQP